MKTYLFIISAALLLSACNQQELADSNRQRDSLGAIVNEREASLNEFISAFNDVERNLDSVAMKQNIIAKNTEKGGELKSSQKERINNEIAAINMLMDDNRKMIAELDRKLKGSSRKNKQLERMITTLNDQLSQKDMELTALNEQLGALNAQVAQLETSVDTLTIINSKQSQTIAEETMALHTAYYIVEKAKALEEAKVIDLRGGLLGIGKTSKLAADIDQSKFTRIDYTQTTSIPVNSEMKIVTSHNSNSYILDKENPDKKKVRNLTITNPELFWSSSKYLVIIKD